MKCFEKKLPGFSIIYLHNPEECYKCMSVTNFEEKISKSQVKFIPKKKFVAKKRCFDNFEPLPSLNDIFKIPEFQFPIPFDPPAIKPLKKIKLLKKKCFINNHSKTLGLKCKKKNCKLVKSFTKLGKKKPTVQESSRVTSVKKKSCNLDKKSKGSKVPGKGTLKRKRWFLKKLNLKNDNYEDDLFENQKFGHFRNLLEDGTDSSEKYEELKTPVFPFSISPRETTPSPTYRDCYSPTQLSISRKGAEEYQYRRKRRRKLCFTENKEAPQVDLQRREDDVQKRLEEVARILNAHQAQNEKTSDSEDDQYFSDVLDDSCSINP